MHELSFESLRRVCDPQTIRCETTEDVLPLEGIIGQERAVKALKFGLDIKENGFNIYVAGHPGTGRETAVKDFLEELAKKKGVPHDWCYVNNFQNPYEPKAIRLDAGKGKTFQKDMADLISKVRRELPAVFESEDYAAKRDETIKQVQDESSALLAQLTKRVQDEGFILQRTPVGVLLIPVVEGKALKEEEFVALDPETREKIQKKRDDLNADLRTVFRQLRSLEAETSEKLKELNREVALYAIEHSIRDLKEKYTNTDVGEYLDEVQNDILDNLQQFLEEPKAPPGPFPASWMKELPFRKYEVNLLIDNSS
ncbi:MAG: AAA family ATPase, partial [Theionarchaea archaeon]|nr:AAA family ATPase [Theionarchaea archaeon]